MNKVILNKPLYPVDPTPKKGDIFRDEGGCLHIVCYVHGYTLVGLADGNWWCAVQKTLEALGKYIKGDLTFVCRKAEITVTPLPLTLI